MSEVLSSIERKSKKTHKCNWCSGKIKKGEIYLSDTLKDDIGIHTWKSHIKCQDFVNKHSYEYGYWDDIPPFSDWDIAEMNGEMLKDFKQVFYD